MERLTEKYECSDKLGQYEDIEKEFEIDSIEDLCDRLTKYKFLANHKMSCVDTNAYNLMLEDLNKYHSIEEELGIDLLTLFKALKNGIIVCCDNPFGGKRNVFISLTHDRLSIEYKNKCLRKGKNKFYFKDYGKTWALTKEELL